jgi:addiction module HigA family antidote
VTEPRPFLPDWTVHPGAFLDEMLDLRGMTPERLAEAAGLPLETVNGLLDGTAPVDAGIAASLGTAFDADPEFWLGSQSRYDADIERGVVSVLTGRGRSTPQELANTP